MTLFHIAAFIGLALAVRLLPGLPDRWRSWAMLGLSVSALFWLQPSTPIRNLDFWLPITTLALTIFTWAVTRPAGPLERESWAAGGLIIGVVLLIALTRYVEPLCCLTPSRPPEIGWLAIPLVLTVVASAGAIRFLSGRSRLSLLLVVGLIALLILLKTGPLAQAMSMLLRRSTGQDPTLATAIDIQWLGISYIAFRLIHTLRDRASGRLPALTLREYATYVLFFPALTAGPIDRAEQFVQDLRRVPPAPLSEDVAAGGQRLALGLFKKFALADALALMALSAGTAAQTQSTFWTWVLMYAYALRIYFDFSGYTDVAIGLGRLFGVRLPENFERPYLKTNLTQFWNSWHITLAQWFRAYYFNPLNRALRGRAWPPGAIIFFTQLTTMLLIGLWHGVSWNFAAWGAWHGLGLFAHNRWLDYTRSRFTTLEQRPRLKRAWEIGGQALTFHYVALGWVWFALPSLDLSVRVFEKLLGG